MTISDILTEHRLHRAICLLYERERERHGVRESIRNVAMALQMPEESVRKILGFGPNTILF